MKKVLIALYGLFFTGFFLKFFHIHFNAVIMLVALGGILIVGILATIKKTPRFSPIIHLSIWCWLVLLLTAIKFFSVGAVGLILASLVTVAAGIEIYRKKIFKQFIAIGISMALALLFYFMPTDERYHLLNIRFNYEIETDIYSWDKYAWFLFQHGKYEEALSAAEEANTIATQTNDQEWIELIGEHKTNIKNRDWGKLH